MTRHAMTRRARIRCALAAAVGLCLCLTAASPAAASPAAAGLAQVRVLGQAPVVAAPLTQVAGFGAVWVLSETEWIGNPSDYTEITKIDQSTNRVVGRLNLGYTTVNPNYYPIGFIAAGAGAVWAIDYNANQLTKIDPATDRVLARVSTGISPTGVAVAAGSVWVSHQHTSAVWRYDPRSLRVTARIPAGNTTQYDSTLGPLSVGHGAVWVSELFQGRVQRIDPRTDRVTTVGVAPSPSCGAQVFVPDGFWLDDTLCGNTIYRYDFARHAVSATITEPACLFPVTYGHGAVWATFAPGRDPSTGACQSPELARFDPITGAALAVRAAPGVGTVTDTPGGLWFGDILAEPPTTVPEFHVARF